MAALLCQAMGSNITIQPAESDADVAAAAALLERYAASLPVDLGYQDFAAERAALPGKYAPPRGALLLARDGDGTPLGCVCLRPLAAAGRSEMKRLFLLSAARGLGLGRRLAEAAITEAARLGYRELVLDTLPTMTAALSLYRQMGFAPIPPYYAPTPAGTVFLALSLASRDTPCKPFRNDG